MSDLQADLYAANKYLESVKHDLSNRDAQVKSLTENLDCLAKEKNASQMQEKKMQNQLDHVMIELVEEKTNLGQAVNKAELL